MAISTATLSSNRFATAQTPPPTSYTSDSQRPPPPTSYTSDSQRAPSAESWTGTYNTAAE
jgi:hypothetical protein